MSALVLLASLAIAPAPVANHPAEVKIVSKPTRAELAVGRIPYLLYLPPGHSTPGSSWPLLVFLHGSRGAGSSPEKLAKYPIPRLIEERRHDVPMVVLAPQCPVGASWSQVAGLMELIDEIGSTYQVDRARTYLAGQSIGAEGVWQLAASHPERFAAIAPMFGEADPAWAEALARLPIWVFHGARDDVVPVGSSDRMVEELRRLGSTSVRYTRDPDGYHRPPADSELLDLLDWLLEHRAAEVD